MEQTVYLDVLLAVNFLVDYLLLLASGRLAGRVLHRKRMLLGALVGSISSLILFVPPLPILLSAAYKLLIAALMVVISFRWKGRRTLLRDTFFLFTVSYLYAGLMLALWQLFPLNMLCYNGVVYFNVSSLLLIGSTVTAYGLLWLFDQFFKRSKAMDRLCQAQLTIGEKTVLLTALMDSGNTLREPFSGASVAVCSLAAVAELLSPEVVETIRRGGTVFSQQEMVQHQLRMIPCQTVAGKQMLMALRPTKLEIVDAQRDVFVVEDVYLALSPTRVGGEDYQILLSPEMMRLTI